MQLPHHIPELLILILLIITFGISSIEKLTDWKGTISFYRTHFKDTIFSNVVPLSVSFVVILEMVTTIMMCIGAYQLLLNDSTQMAVYGLLLSTITLLILLIGQRIAKDYEGAMTIVVYYIPTIFGLYLLTN